MKPLIAYQSRTGNTHIIADTIASVLDADMISIERLTPKDIKDRSLVGFGSGIYWTRVGEKVYDIATFLPQECNVFMFITSGLGTPLMVRLYWYFIQNRFKGLGMQLTGKWNCRGYDKHPISKWMDISKENPNHTDIESAKRFALKMKKVNLN